MNIMELEDEEIISKSVSTCVSKEDELVRKMNTMELEDEEIINKSVSTCVTKDDELVGLMNIMEVENEVMLNKEPEEEGNMENLVRTTCRFMRLHRRAKWEVKMGWDDDDEERIQSSKEVNPEDLQDYSSPQS